LNWGGETVARTLLVEKSNREIYNHVEQITKKPSYLWKSATVKLTTMTGKSYATGAWFEGELVA